MVALLFVIFDVEVAFFFPWAVVFGKVNALASMDEKDPGRAAIIQQLVPVDPNTEETATPQISVNDATRLGWLAFLDLLVFFGVLLVGFAYLWRRGDLDWVRSTAAERAAAGPVETASIPEPERALVGATKG